MRFQAKQDFFSREMGSQYCAGLFYTVRPGNTALAALVPTWLREGKVGLVKGADAQLTGTDKPRGFFERIKSWL